MNIKLTDRWSVGGGVRYDLDADEIASDMFQVRYGDECFVLTATYTDNYYVNPDIVDGQTLMLRFELKHLGSSATRPTRSAARYKRAAVGRLTLSAAVAAVPARAAPV